jgi:hypothetical protein
MTRTDMYEFFIRTGRGERYDTLEKRWIPPGQFTEAEKIERVIDHVMAGGGRPSTTDAALEIAKALYPREPSPETIAAIRAVLKGGGTDEAARHLYEAMPLWRELYEDETE